MTDTATRPLPVVPLTVLGSEDAASCVGDFCEIPDHHNQVIVNRRLDDDAV